MIRLIHNVKTHVDNIVWAHDLKYTVFVAVGIVFRRFAFLDLSLFKSFRGEGHLEQYMTPLHDGVFVDVGANYGMWTRYVAEKGFKVVAFEPSPRPHASLAKSNMKNVTVHNVALGDAEAEATLYLHKNSGNDGFINREKWFTGETVNVPVRTLDSFKLENVGLIKIDTQGYETQVIRGACETVKRCKPRVVAEVHSHLRSQSKQICALLRGMGLKVRVIVKRGSIQPYIIGEPC